MCIFCSIAEGKIPSYKVYESDQVFAFLDINPVSLGHVLVIPKKHYQNLEEIEEEDLKVLILAVKKIGRLLKDKLGIAGYNISVNNDPIAGQEIPHLHFHVIPRCVNDGINFSWKTREYADGEAEEILKKLQS